MSEAEFELEVEIERNLFTDQCVCGKKKTRHQSFCKTDYYKLPPEKRSALYHQFGSGYEQAFQDAAIFLGIDLMKVFEI